MPNKKSGAKRKRGSNSAPGFFQPEQPLLARPLLEREIALSREVREKYSVKCPGKQDYWCLPSGEYREMRYAENQDNSPIILGYFTAEEHRFIQEKYGIALQKNQRFRDTRPVPIQDYNDPHNLDHHF